MVVLVQRLSIHIYLKGGLKLGSLWRWRDHSFWLFILAFPHLLEFVKIAHLLKYNENIKSYTYTYNDLKICMQAHSKKLKY